MKPLPTWTRIIVMAFILLSIWMSVPMAEQQMQPTAKIEYLYELSDHIVDLHMMVEELILAEELDLCHKGNLQFCDQEELVFGEEAAKEMQKHLGKYLVSRYYSVVEGQTRYYYGEYEKDYRINCHGDCTRTANGYDLKTAKPFTVAACPPDIPLWSVLDIEGIGRVTCVDRGGAIKGKRIDLWAGIGDEGVTNILTKKNAGEKHVTLISS